MRVCVCACVCVCTRTRVSLSTYAHPSVYRSMSISSVHVTICLLVHLFACLSHLFVCLSIFLSVRWSTCSTICLICLSVRPPAYLSAGPPVHPSDPSVCLPVHFPICPLLHPFAYLSHLFVCPPAYLSAGPPVSLSVSSVCLSTCLSVRWSTC